MLAWLKSFFTDEAMFTASVRGLLGVAGAVLTLLPADALAGLGKYGTLVMALGMFLKAGDKNTGAK